MDRKTKKTREVREIGARTNTERRGGVAAVRARRRSHFAAGGLSS